jgi:hypothetical protein
MKFIHENAEDLLLIAGFAAILFGTYKVSPLAAWFVGGVECLVAAILVAWSKKTNDSQ